MNTFLLNQLSTLFSHNTYSTLNEKVIPQLTHQQKKIALIAALAFAYVAACYAMIRWYLKNEEELALSNATTVIKDKENKTAKKIFSKEKNCKTEIKDEQTSVDETIFDEELQEQQKSTEKLIQPDKTIVDDQPQKQQTNTEKLIQPDETETTVDDDEPQKQHEISEKFIVQPYETIFLEDKIQEILTEMENEKGDEYKDIEKSAPETLPSKYWLKAIKINPNNASAFYHLAKLSRGKTTVLLDRTFTDERSLYLKAIELNPNYVEAYYEFYRRFTSRFGSVQFLNGTEIDREQLCLKVIQLAPEKYSDVYEDLAAVLAFDKKENVTLLDGTIMNRKDLHLKAIHLNPKACYPYANLAYSLSKSNEESIKLLDGTIMTKKQLSQKSENLLLNKET